MIFLKKGKFILFSSLSFNLFLSNLFLSTSWQEGRLLFCQKKGLKEASSVRGLVMVDEAMPPQVLLAR